MTPVATSSSDRLSFTIFVAAVLHAILIFGVVFTAPKVHLPQVMEVTLVQHRNKDADRNADFLSNANQHGSGTLDHAALVTSPHQSRFHDDRINDLQLKQQLTVSRASLRNQQVITTTGLSSQQIRRRKAEPLREDQDEVQQVQLAMALQSSDISSLEARLTAKKQAYAKRPRVHAVSTVSARFDRDAAYVDYFRQKVEAVGNKNYPELARQKKIYGNVRLMVSIRADGHVERIDVLEHAASPILDEAARQSVRLAAPFKPFPPEIRRDVDILQIIRTWKFTDRLTSSDE
jgi:protein TonB